MSCTSCGLRRMTTLSPACSTPVSSPSQNSVVPGFTLAATSTSELRDETTTGRNERLCGQIGVTQKASTPLSTIGPPADRLYAVEPLGVAAMTPSPKNRTAPLSPAPAPAPPAPAPAPP